MEKEIKKIQMDVSKLTEQVSKLEFQLKTLTDTSYKTSGREIINREVQFLQKVYDKNGAIVTEINA